MGELPSGNRTWLAASWEITLFSGHQWKIHRTKWWIFQCYAWLLEAILIGTVLLFPLQSSNVAIEIYWYSFSKLIFLSESGNFQATGVCLQIGYPTFLRVTIFLTRAVWWGPPFWDKPMLVGKACVECMSIIDHHDLARKNMHTVSIYNVNPGTLSWTLSWTLSCLIGRVAASVLVSDFEDYHYLRVTPILNKPGWKKIHGWHLAIFSWNVGIPKQRLEIQAERGSRCLLCALVPTSRAASRAAERWKWLSHASQTQLFVCKISNIFKNKYNSMH